MSTTETAVQKIEQLIIADDLPSAQSLARDDYDSLLDARDADEFATPWTNAYNAISETYNVSGFNESEKGRIDKIREHLFKRIDRQTKVSDLSSYVSDDFDLILKCLLTGTENTWVNALWLSYKNGNIPSGALNDVSGELKDLVTA